MPETFLCKNCGEEYPLSERCEFEGHVYCTRCFSEVTVVCRHCGIRIWAGANAGNADTPLCENCYDRHYTTCESCGALIRNNEAWYEDEGEDDGPYCYNCHRRHGTTIHEYFYKPEPIFYGSGPRFFGVELEIDGAGESERKVEEIEDAANGGVWEHVYIKHDGSLDDGLEIVTHPMSLDYHMTEMPCRLETGHLPALPIPQRLHLRPAYPCKPQSLWGQFQ